MSCLLPVLSPEFYISLSCPIIIFFFHPFSAADLKIKLSHETTLKVFHPRAMDLYNTTADLKRVCYLVANPKLITEELSLIKVGVPFRVQLASRADWRQTIRRLGGAPFVIEPKYDGERLIIHKHGSRLKLFTRYVGSLLPHTMSCCPVGVASRLHSMAGVVGVLVVCWLFISDCIRKPRDYTHLYGEVMMDILKKVLPENLR